MKKFFIFFAIFSTIFFIKVPLNIAAENLEKDYYLNELFESIGLNQNDYVAERRGYSFYMGYSKKYTGNYSRATVDKLNDIFSKGEEILSMNYIISELGPPDIIWFHKLRRVYNDYGYDVTAWWFKNEGRYKYCIAKEYSEERNLYKDFESDYEQIFIEWKVIFPKDIDAPGYNEASGVPSDSIDRFTIQHFFDLDGYNPASYDGKQ